MAEIRDFFIKTLDEAEFGINSMMSKLTNQVRANDPEIWLRLHQQELCPQYYSFRYCTLSTSSLSHNYLYNYTYVYSFSIWNKMVDSSPVARVSSPGCHEDMGFLVCRREQIQFPHTYLLCHDPVSTASYRDMLISLWRFLLWHLYTFSDYWRTSC